MWSQEPTVTQNVNRTGSADRMVTAIALVFSLLLKAVVSMFLQRTWCWWEIFKNIPSS
jgi:hypothetical protein